MVRFSGPQAGVRRPTSPLVTTGAQTRTFEGGVGYVKDPRTELFQLAVTYMADATFYESKEARDERFRTLVAQATAEDPVWTARLIGWLRGTGANLRTAPLVAAMEYALAKGPNPRKVIDSAMARADEPAEALGYWFARTGRHTLPGGVQRGIAQAATRLYFEKAALKYDGSSRRVRMGDVIELAHPRPRVAWQSALFRWLLDRRHRSSEARTPDDVKAQLPTVSARERLEAMLPNERRGYVEGLLTGETDPELWERSGPTWEWLSGWLQGPMDAIAWQAVLPSMGYMARLRNLRNLDDAGVSDQIAEQVAVRLADPDEVSRSRQLPYRFLSAWKAAQGMRWATALEKALELSMSNVPALPGRTLVLTDTSGSMQQGVSDRSTVTRTEVAALFAVALAKRGSDVSLVQFASGWQRVQVNRGASVLRIVEGLTGQIGAVGHGTETFKALSEAYQGEDRVVIITDQQAFPPRWLTAYPTPAAPPEQLVRKVVGDKPVYTFDVAGYAPGHLPSGSSGFYALGGLTDATFAMIPMLESGRDAKWPWEPTG